MDRSSREFVTPHYFLGENKPGVVISPPALENAGRLHYTYVTNTTPCSAYNAAQVRN
jgi:hypothetical protein